MTERLPHTVQSQTAVLSPSSAYRVRKDPMELPLIELSAKSEIFIRTQRSEYLFELTNPARLCGILTGGILGQQQRYAIVAGPTILRIGTRTTFILDQNPGLARLITSLITGIELISASAKKTICLEDACYPNTSTHHSLQTSTLDDIVQKRDTTGDPW